MFIKFLLVLALVAVVAADTCPGSAVPFNGRCYVMGNTKQSWGDARAACQAMSGDLAIIHDANENQFIVDTFLAGNMWIGLNDLSSEGNFVWADGSTTEYRNWQPNEPSNGNGSGNPENCVAMGAWGTSGEAKWNDAECAAQEYAMCMLDAPATPPPPTNCPGDAVAYQGRCYAVGKMRTDWFHAQGACQSMGGDLVTMRDEMENQFVVDNFQLGNMWIGLNDNAMEGNFVWADGSGATYRNWQPNEPSNGNGNGSPENCVAMGAMGTSGEARWNDAECSAQELPMCMLRVPATYACPMGSLESNGKCLVVSNMMAAWTPARDACRSMGGDLATIHDAAENQALLANIYGKVAAPYVWIGLNDMDSEGNFVWSDGSPADYRNWFPGDPTNGGMAGPENCVALGTTAYRMWNDATCEDSAYYVCALPRSPPTCTLGMTTSCDMKVATRLSRQIREEFIARSGVSFSKWDPEWVTCANDKCSGYLQTAAAHALKKAAQDEGVPIPIIADWRSSAQVYLRYRWINNINNDGMCRANKNSMEGDNMGSGPGNDFHAAGRVVSVKKSAARHWKPELKAQGFHMPKPNEDDNYFEYLQQPQGAEVAAAEVKAFQTLWNRNMPGMAIKITGKFDFPTQQAYAMAPCGGW